MKRAVKVAILGAGSAGLAALREVRKRTDDFLIVNAGPYGTTCARVGCMPSKALIAAAAAYHSRHGLFEFGVRGAEALEVDVPAVLERVRSLRDRFVEGTLTATRDLGDRSVAGHARFRSATRLEIEGVGEVRAERVIIATGARPVLPARWRELGEAVFTSDDVFELRDLPRRLAVVGLGPVGAELAQAAARLGVEVVAFDEAQTVGGLTDPQVSATAVAALEGEFAMHLGATVNLSRAHAGVRIQTTQGDWEVDAVLATVGRRPNVDGLGLETLGVELDSRGVPRYDPETLQVGELPVFIAGDANGTRPLLHEAADEGRIAGYNATRETAHCFQRRCPLLVTFTSPNLAVVGRGWDQVAERRDVAAGSVDFSDQSRALMANENRGSLRVYAAQESGQLLGAELAAPAGEHLAHLLAWAIQGNLDVFAALRRPFYHPVVEEGLRSALWNLASHLPQGRDTAELLLCRPGAEPALC